MSKKPPFSLKLLTSLSFVASPPLFNIGNPEALDDDHILQMIELLGPLPDNLTRVWSSYGQYFDEHDVQTSFRNEWAPDMDFMFSNSPSIHGENHINDNDAGSVGKGVEHGSNDEGPL